jgi:hypothetical protein
MTDQQPKDPTRSALLKGKESVKKSPAETEADASNSDRRIDVSKLTPEEQMARFEKDLKENDWGHQPC